MPNIIDSHAHLTSDVLFENIDEILKRAQEVGVSSIVNICTDVKTLERGLELQKNHPWIYNAAATTPHDVVEEGEVVFPIIEKAAWIGDLVAIGETGLEYFYYPETKETQKKFFIRYLHLALDTQLPIIIHCRDAFDDLFEIIDAEYRVEGRHAPGVLHCFTGNLAEAENVLSREWYLSLSGIVTFKRSEELREVAKMVPIEKLLIETDSPYLAPQSKRGKQNEPSLIVETAQLIADIKGISLESLVEQTAHNAQMFFSI